MVARFECLFAVRPSVLAHDLHPEYATTRYARERALAEGLECLAVQHHHAHMASALAEHGLAGPAIGVTFDGTGYGTDGTLWGGEFLVGDCRSFRRAAHLRPVPLPGGERAVREPWRMALSVLLDAGLAGEAADLLGGRLPLLPLRGVERMIERRVNAPLSSSAGRLFDAVAALCGVRDRTTFEGQAAMELEALAAEAPEDGAYPFDLPGGITPLVVDTRPLVRAVAADCRRGAARSGVARRFHRALAAIVGEVCGRLRAVTGVDTVVLSGGVFQNALLSAEAAARLAGEGFRVYAQERVPCNDGGLALGQLAVAAATLHAAGEESAR
jgi:hydrogenase maturation protein HypF